MNYLTHTCQNGLRIIYLPSTSPVIYCGLAVKAGTRHELPGEEGLAHFCEHLCFKGTHRRTAMQIINALEGVGGELNAFTNKEDTVYYAATTQRHFRQAVDVLCDIVFCSEFPQHEVEKEREVVCDEIESYEDTPSELIFDEFENLLFEGHPLGHNILGTSEQVRSYNSEDARRFTRRYYRPDNSIFFASGDIDYKQLVKILEIIDNPGNPESSEHPVYPELPSPREGLGVGITRHRSTHQSHVMIGTRAFAAGTSSIAAIALFSAVSRSWLTRSIRMEKSWYSLLVFSPIWVCFSCWIFPRSSFASSSYPLTRRSAYSRFARAA